MPRYKVTSEFIDKETGQRKFPGDVIEADNERIDRLKKAGVIGSEIIETKPKAEEPTPANEPEEAETQEETTPAKRRKARG